MIELIGEYIFNINLFEFILLFISLCVTLIAVFAILTNVLDWLYNVYFYYNTNGWFQLSYPNYEDTIIKYNYNFYVVGERTGEIFYINEKRLKKLKKRELVHWDDSISCYVFRDEEVEIIKNTIKPLITIYNENKKTTLKFK